MEITGHTMEELLDPTGILVGERYEFLLEIDLPEDDELYSEHGLLLRLIIAVEGDDVLMKQYHFVERNTEKVLDFELEDEEEVLVLDYCKNNLT